LHGGPEFRGRDVGMAKKPGKIVATIRNEVEYRVQCLVFQILKYEEIWETDDVVEAKIQKFY